jgi:glycosyltransferase involved in cell wall biosynthesis
MDEENYSVVIRTFNSQSTIDKCISSIRSQALLPKEIIVVDSGSTDLTLDIASKAGSRIVKYPMKEAFNYSRSLNIGIKNTISPFVLVISSHVYLQDVSAAKLLLGELSANSCAIGVYAVSLTYRSSQQKPSRVMITNETFTGFNGLHNSCSMIRRTAWIKYPFSEGIWTAEDQEWAARHFSHDAASTTIRLEGLKVRYANTKSSQWKSCSEFVAISAVVCRVSPMRTLRYVLSSIIKTNQISRLRGDIEFLHQLCLLLYWLKLLKFTSNYDKGAPFLLRYFFHDIFDDENN